MDSVLPQNRPSSLSRAAKLAIVVYAVLSLSGIGRGKDLMDRTLDAIERVESNGDANAVGDGGKARGTFQIHRAYWTDGCKLLGVSWPYEDATNRVKARAVVRAYLTRYARRYGQRPSVWARIHNGGPHGPLRGRTWAYWQKVKTAIR